MFPAGAEASVGGQQEERIESAVAAETSSEMRRERIGILSVELVAIGIYLVTMSRNERTAGSSLIMR